MKNKAAINWDKIDTVLLDMDGTLIDQHHEDVFWGTMVPEAYARKHGISVKEAEGIVFGKYDAKKCHLDWGNIDAWEKDLGMKLWKMRRRIKPFIRLHPHTARFLRFLKRRGKKVYLVSSAPRSAIDFELAHTKIGKYFDGIYTQTDIGKSKHDGLFWKRLQRKLKFDRHRTLLAEDNEGIARAAKKFGMKYVIFKSKSSSRKPPYIPRGLLCVRHFDDIL